MFREAERTFDYFRKSSWPRSGRTLGYLRTPKSAVTIVTGWPEYVPGADGECTAERPISRHRAFSRFALCSGLLIHMFSACVASTSGEDQRRFSPTDQKWW